MADRRKNILIASDGSDHAANIRKQILTCQVRGGLVSKTQLRIVRSVTEKTSSRKVFKNLVVPCTRGQVGVVPDAVAIGVIDETTQTTAIYGTGSICRPQKMEK